MRSTWDRPGAAFGRLSGPLAMEKYYRHFKGGLYKFIGIAKDSETLEDVVIYQAIYGDNQLWVRPADMFFGKVERDGKVMDRFEEVEVPNSTPHQQFPFRASGRKTRILRTETQHTPLQKVGYVTLYALKGRLCDSRFKRSWTCQRRDGHRLPKIASRY